MSSPFTDCLSTDCEHLALLSISDYDVESGAAMVTEKTPNEDDSCAGGNQTSSPADQLSVSRRAWFTASLCLLAVLAYLFIFGYLVLLGIRNQEHLHHEEEAELMGTDNGEWLD